MMSEIPQIHVECHTASGGLPPATRSAWEACLSQAPPELHLYNWDWVDAWMRHYASASPWTGVCHVLVAIRNNSPVLILPLAERQQSGLRILSLAGFYQPLRSPVYTAALRPEDAQALVAHLLHKLKHWNLCRFSPVDTASPGRAILVNALCSATSTIQTDLGRTIVNRLQPSLEDHRKSKSFKRIESYERRFLRAPDARLEHLSGSQEAGTMLQHLAHIEQNSWLASQGGDMRFTGEQNRAFWENVLKTTLVPNRQFDAWIAFLGEKPIGFRVALTSGSTSYMIANQFDESYAETRIGWVLYLQHLRSAFTRKVHLIDSAPGDLHYKGRLGGEEAEMRCSLLCFPPTVRGRMLCGALQAATALRNRLEKKPWGQTLAARIPRL